MREDQAAMDYAACNIVLVDRAAAEDKLVRRDDVLASPVSTGPPATVDSLAEQVCERANLMETNLQTLLETFNEGTAVLSSPQNPA